MKYLYSIFLFPLVLFFSCTHPNEFQLNGLATYEGDLIINDNSDIPSNSIDVITGNVRLSGELNEELLSQSLSAIKEIKGSLVINNSNIHNLTFFTNLESVGLFVSLQHNKNLTHIDFPKLKAISNNDTLGYINIYGMSKLQSVSFNNLIKIGGIRISTSFNVDTIQFNTLKEAKYINIFSSSITDMLGFKALSKALDIRLINSYQLLSLEGLGQLKTIANIELTSNKKLENLCAIYHLLDTKTTIEISMIPGVSIETIRNCNATFNY